MNTGTPLRVAGDFDPALAPLLEPALAGLAAQLGSIPGLASAERQAVREAAAAAIYETVHRKLSRLLVLELNAARLTGTLTAADPAARFAEWLAGAATIGFWDKLSAHYPPLRGRLTTLVDNRCAAAATLARRFSADRAALAALTGAEPGALTAVRFGAGDSHRGGQTVAILRCTDGAVVYKPRSVEVDAVLARLLRTLLPDEPDHTRIRVPEVIERDGYGWAEHVAHRYCAGDTELRAFYRGMGHWLAVMRLLGGSDLHSENLIAAGPVPVVVDCETLYTPIREATEPSGYGLAIDRAAELVNGTVLRTGLLPGRGVALGFRGVDNSGMGSLPGQQPAPMLPAILDSRTDEARIGLARASIPLAANHPSPEPVLGRYWRLVEAGFVELTERLRAIDREGVLEPLLAGFAECPVRVVPRATETYAELARMLWHPASLHDEPPARRRAAGLLAKQAENFPGAPGDPAVIDAEIGELLVGDVPFFAMTPRDGTLSGPGGTSWGSGFDVVADTLRRWRDGDLALDRQVTSAALVSAYLNEGWLPDGRRLHASRVRGDDLDRRRRVQAARIVRTIAGAALRADDGSVTWIAPVLNPTGWAVTPAGPDLYSGAPGLAVLFGAYVHEVRHGRADEVAGLDSLLADLVRTMRTGQEQAARDRANWRRTGRDGTGLDSAEQDGAMRAGAGRAGAGRDGARDGADQDGAGRDGAGPDGARDGTGRDGAVREGADPPAMRPAPPGGYLGLGSQISAWLLLSRFGAIGVESVVLAEAQAAMLDEAVAADESLDVLLGMAGAVVPLLRLAEHTGAERWADLASRIGYRLIAAGTPGGSGGPAGQPGRETMCWPTDAFPQGIGGFAHGATGIGWALARLAAATGDPMFARVAMAAFDHEESLYEPRRRGWRDLRTADAIAVAWCHGAGGIGIAAADLLRLVYRRPLSHDSRRWREVLRRAAESCWEHGFGWNHTLCHGDLGAWEVLDEALTAGVGPPGADRPTVDARVLSSIEEHGPTSGLARDAFAPGLLPGLGGTAYQLLRMHPDCPLPSVLLPDPGPPT